MKLKNTLLLNWAGKIINLNYIFKIILLMIANRWGGMRVLSSNQTHYLTCFFTISTNSTRSKGLRR